jgi:hypothetical protein
MRNTTESGSGDGYQSPTNSTPDRPPLFGGPNLRGSLNREQQTQTGQAEAPPRGEREPKLAALGALPELHSDYPSWRFQMRANIVGSGLSKKEYRKYLVDMETANMEDLPDMNLNTENLNTIDSRLYTAVINALKANKKQATYLLKIQQKCVEGSGRQAVRILDGIYKYEGAQDHL